MNRHRIMEMGKPGPALVAALCAACVLGACNKKATREDGAIADTSTQAAVPSAEAYSGTGGVRVVAEAKAGTYVISVIDGRGAKTELEIAESNPEIDTNGAFIWVKYDCGPPCNESWFISKADAGRHGPFRYVLGANLQEGIVAYADSDEITVRRLERPREAIFVRRNFAQGFPLGQLLDSTRLSGRSLSYCYDSQRSEETVCDTLQFTPSQAPTPYACGAPSGGGACPAVTLDLDRDGKADTVQLIALTGPVGFTPSKVIQDPWGESLLSPREKLALRARLSSRPEREYLLHNDRYFASPDWDDAAGRLKQLKVGKGGTLALPTQAGDDAILSFDGRDFRLAYSGEGD